MTYLLIFTLGLLVGWVLGISAARVLRKELDEAMEWKKRPRKVVA